MDPIDPYLEAIRGTTRVLRAQRTLQEACNTLPPGALTRLYLTLQEPEFSWLAPDLPRIAPGFRYMTAAPRRRYAKLPQLALHPGNGAVTRYETPGAERSQKRLYILFTGDQGQFFLPLAMILYLLPPGPKDVLVIRGRMYDFYLNGLEGLGQRVPEICASLRDRYRTADYAHVTVAGFSASAHHAMQVADGLAADLCVTFAARLPYAALRLRDTRDHGMTPFSALCACIPGRVKRQVNVVPSKIERDVMASRRIARLRPGTVQYHLVFPRNHNVLAQVLKTRTIRPFMALVMARNGLPLGIVAPVFQLLGSIVRQGRLLSGRQKRRLPQ